MSVRSWRIQFSQPVVRLVNESTDRGELLAVGGRNEIGRQARLVAKRLEPFDMRPERIPFGFLVATQRPLPLEQCRGRFADILRQNRSGFVCDPFLVIPSPRSLEFLKS